MQYYDLVFYITGILMVSDFKYLYIIVCINILGQIF